MAVIDVIVDDASALPTDTDLVGRGCFICYGDDAPLVKLECCGTAVCRTCINTYVLVQARKGRAYVRCPCPSCSSKRWRLADARRYLADPAAVDELSELWWEGDEASKRCSYTRGCDGVLQSVSGAFSHSTACDTCGRSGIVSWHTSTKGDDDNDEAFKRWAATRAHVKPCPSCGAFIEKVGGCDLMACACGHKFCWLCAQPHATHSAALCSAAQVAAHPAWGPREVQVVTKPLGVLIVASIGCVAACVAAAIIVPAGLCSGLMYAVHAGLRRTSDQVSLARL